MIKRFLKERYWVPSARDCPVEGPPERLAKPHVTLGGGHDVYATFTAILVRWCQGLGWHVMAFRWLSLPASFVIHRWPGIWGGVKTNMLFLRIAILVLHSPNVLLSVLNQGDAKSSVNCFRRRKVTFREWNTFTNTTSSQHSASGGLWERVPEWECGGGCFTEGFTEQARPPQGEPCCWEHLVLDSWCDLSFGSNRDCS